MVAPSWYLTWLGSSWEFGYYLRVDGKVDPQTFETDGQGGLCINTPNCLDITEFTWEGWVYEETLGATWGGLVSCTDQSWSSGFGIWANQDDTWSCFINSWTGVISVLEVKRKHKEWYHLCITVGKDGDDDSHFRVYINGSLHSSVIGKLSGSLSGKSMCVGYSDWNGELFYFDGRLSELRMWNYCRTASQVAQNYKRVIPKTKGLIMLHRFHENMNRKEVILDLSDHGNDANVFPEHSKAFIERIGRLEIH